MTSEAPSAPPLDDAFAVKLRGFGPVGIVAMIVVVSFGPILEPFGVLPSPAWVHRSRMPWRSISP